MRAARTLVIASLSVGLLVGAAGPAMADIHYNAGPTKVVVNQAYENIHWSIGGSDRSWVDDVDATLEHVATREEADYDYASAAPFSGTFRLYDFERMGRYKIDGDVYDSDYNQMSAAPAYVTVKRAARARVSAARSKRRVTLTAVTRKYTGSYPLWGPHRGATIRFQRKTSSSTWRTIANRTVASNGVNRFSFRFPARTYRVLVVETGSVWGTTSNTVRR
jgi:hypothetical protein